MSYNNVAFNLNGQGKYAEAGPLFQKALDIHRKVLGEDHPDTATSYNNVAFNLNAQGKYADSAGVPGSGGPLLRGRPSERRRRRPRTRRFRGRTLSLPLPGRRPQPCGASGRRLGGPRSRPGPRLARRDGAAPRPRPDPGGTAPTRRAAGPAEPRWTPASSPSPAGPTHRRRNRRAGTARRPAPAAGQVPGGAGRGS